MYFLKIRNFICIFSGTSSITAIELKMLLSIYLLIPAYPKSAYKRFWFARKLKIQYLVYLFLLNLHVNYG